MHKSSSTTMVDRTISYVVFPSSCQKAEIRKGILQNNKLHGFSACIFFLGRFCVQGLVCPCRYKLKKLALQSSYMGIWVGEMKCLIDVLSLVLSIYMLCMDNLWSTNLMIKSSNEISLLVNKATIDRFLATSSVNKATKLLN